MPIHRCCLVLCLVGCDDGDDAAVIDAAPPPADAARDVLATPDVQVPRVPPGEACVSDASCEGPCVNGVCSPACGDDDDCGPGLACIERSGAARCTRTCGGSGDCAAGLLCVVRGPASGFCVAPGPGAGGVDCELREDCASWFCGAGRCLSTCADGGCPAETTCLALHTQSVCIPAGDGADEAACAQGADCASGVCRGGRCTVSCAVGGDCPNDRVCLLYEALGLCERRCADSGDCGETGICAATGGRRLCETRGDGAAGAMCDRDRGCASGHCAAGECAAPCDPDCPLGTACVRDISGAACRAAGAGAAGSACVAGDQCESGVCGGGRCGRDCESDAECAEGARCASFANGRFCFPRCERSADCEAVAWCSLAFEGGPICFWRGAVEDGERCARDSDCESGRCHDGRCLPECPDGVCPAGRRCVDFGTGDWCVTPPLPALAACDRADDCAEGLTCTGGRCTPSCAESCPAGTTCVDGACHPSCVDGGDCRPGRRCNRTDGVDGYCAAPGGLDVAAQCGRSAECASGLCFGGRCRPPCEAGCAGGDACLRLRDDAWCVPAGESDPGARCTTDRECASGLCIGRRCAVPCDAGCPAGLECRALTTGDFCVSECVPPGGCDPDEVCDPTSRRCVLGGGGAGVGEVCETRDECVPEAAACVDSGDGARCRAWCSADFPCGGEEACVSVGGVGACVPAGDGGGLASCDASRDCRGGRCLASYLDGRCFEPCAAGCGEAQACVDLARDPAAPVLACAPSCAVDGECEAPLRCRRTLEGSSACY